MAVGLIGMCYPSLISVWDLTADGKFLELEGAVRPTIQDEDGMIRKNYLDESMRNIMSDFTNLLNYYAVFDYVRKLQRGM